jgi:hypothetical protein
MSNRYAARHDVNGLKYIAISYVWPIAELVKFAKPRFFSGYFGAQQGSVCD